jgi:hypothetical protein
VIQPGITLILFTNLLPRTRLGPGRDAIEQDFTQRPDMVIKPAGIAGVHGRHHLAEPVPWVGSGTGSGWRKLACGKTQLS